MGNLSLTLAMFTSEMHFSGSRNSSFLTRRARSCSLKCWINWQVVFFVFCFFLPTSTTHFCPTPSPKGYTGAIGSSLSELSLPVEALGPWQVCVPTCPLWLPPTLERTRKHETDLSLKPHLSPFWGSYSPLPLPLIPSPLGRPTARSELCLLSHTKKGYCIGLVLPTSPEPILSWPSKDTRTQDSACPTSSDQGRIV